MKLGHLKHSIIGMLDTYFYESNILKDAKTLVVGDTFENTKELYNRTVSVGRTYKKICLRRKRVFCFFMKFN